MSLSWGVDGFGRAHLTSNGRDIIFSGLVGYSGLSLMYYYEDMKLKEVKKERDLSFVPPKEIIKAEVFKVSIGDTEHVFDDMESAKFFKLGYEHGFLTKERVSKVKSYADGYFTGVAHAARGVNKNA